MRNTDLVRLEGSPAWPGYSLWIVGSLFYLGYLFPCEHFGSPIRVNSAKRRFTERARALLRETKCRNLSFAKKEMVLDDCYSGVDY